MQTSWRTVTCVLACGGLLACRAQTSWSGELSTASYAQFEREVYPVLMRDCAYANCHGAEQRFFQIWGPGRTRLDTKDKRTPIVEQEKWLSYQRTLSMLYTDGSRPLSESPLLVKPLEASSGGAAHGGVDHYGRNIYRSTSDPAYVTLWRWASAGPASANVSANAGTTAASAGSGTLPSAGIGAIDPVGAAGTGTVVMDGKP